jgi:hypothetical protein
MKFFAIIGIVVTVAAVMLLLRHLALRRGRNRNE